MDISTPCWKLADSGSESPGSSPPRDRIGWRLKKKKKEEKMASVLSVTSYSDM